jgi:hypothetical protein
MAILKDFGVKLYVATQRSRDGFPKCHDLKRQTRWHATIGSEQNIEIREPQTSWWRRFEGWLLEIALEKQL